MEKKWLDRGACPKCGSSDGNVKHSEGYSYCFSCNTRFGEQMEHEKVIPIPTESNIKTVGVTGALTERNISKETAQKYHTQVKVNGNMNTHHIYKYFDSGGNNIGNYSPIVMTSGLGTKINLGYFLLKIEAAWDRNENGYSKPQWYFSLGPDW